jgi:hypothetical protein
VRLHDNDLHWLRDHIPGFCAELLHRSFTRSAQRLLLSALGARLFLYSLYSNYRVMRCSTMRMENQPMSARHCRPSGTCSKESFSGHAPKQVNSRSEACATTLFLKSPISRNMAPNSPAEAPQGRRCGTCGSPKPGVNCMLCGREASRRYYAAHRAEVSARRAVQRKNWTPEQREASRRRHRSFYLRHQGLVEQVCCPPCQDTRHSIKVPVIES